MVVEIGWFHITRWKMGVSLTKYPSSNKTGCWKGFQGGLGVLEIILFKLTLCIWKGVSLRIIWGYLFWHIRLNNNSSIFGDNFFSNWNSVLPVTRKQLGAPTNQPTNPLLVSRLFANQDMYDALVLALPNDKEAPQVFFTEPHERETWSRERRSGEGSLLVKWRRFFEGWPVIKPSSVGEHTPEKN